MTKKSFTHLTLLSGLLLALLFALPLNNKSISAAMTPAASAQASMSYEDFIRTAYQGALGRQPTCEELQGGYDALASAAATGSIREGARQLVSTLFETQSSYNDTSQNTYLQTTEYQARNPQDATDSVHQQAFVTDLYHAFLGREPDSDGFASWLNVLPSIGRRRVLDGFGFSQEFINRADSLFAGIRPTCDTGCGSTCPAGYTRDPDTCECIPPCQGPNTTHFNPLCQQ